MDILELHRRPDQVPGTPAREPLDMPAQNFGGNPGTTETHAPIHFRWSTLAARLFVFMGTAAGAGYGVWEISMVVEAGGTTLLENALFALFALTFTWIAFAACTALAGFVAGWTQSVRQKQFGTNVPGRTAILVPVYNESPGDVQARIQAMANDLIQSKSGHDYEFFILSDTRDPDIWVEEEVAVMDLRTAIGSGMPVWYRRRHSNEGRKAGNVAEFVRNWGGRYDFMIVLDADSLMTAQTLNALVFDIAGSPETALVQTAPKLVNASTIFSRSQQFANQVYGPVFARGLASWQGSNGNFWGHNAIIRVQAFAAAAGLPTLKGKAPFGGSILSHDFVEAALLRRSGWSVRMRPDLVGSYEEMPPTLADVSVRDRRWLQGNLQHMNLLAAKGFTPISRLHFVIGIMSYLTSPLWFLLILTGLALSVQAHFIRPEYFTDAASLFPMWPRFDTERMLNLLLVTLCVLFTPKTLGFLDTLFQIRKLSAIPSLILGFVTETIFAALIAPIMMLIHSRHFISILFGRDGGWTAQSRSVMRSGWRKSVQQQIPYTLIGIALAIAAYTISFDIFLWMLPILAGLVFSIPLAYLSERRMGVRLASFLFPDLVALTDPAGRDLVGAHADLTNMQDTQMIRTMSGLFLVLTNAEARIAHNSLLMIKPQKRGHPEPAYATAAAKIEDAETIDELMTWLTKAEQVAILGAPDLIARAAQLAPAHSTGTTQGEIEARKGLAL